MKRQGYDDRMDESLGMRRGKESGKKQSYKDRRDESMGAKKGNYKYMSKGMELKDNTQASQVRSIKIPEGQGFKEVKPFYQGSRGYPSEAYNYDY